ncbi:far upstream element-binding protein 1-like [Forsythia ovata]|uniref:Far upstream element-binding protein 1-like n=1 Tax=Forsythia ovata TaxID=205694 RepID=A0ABD1VLU6_9LAMI
MGTRQHMEPRAIQIKHLHLASRTMLVVSLTLIPIIYAPQGSTQPAYGALPTSRGGFGTLPPASYGPPQAQKTPTGQPAYGQQPQQSPSAQGGYDKPDYPHSQPPPTQTGYSQIDSGALRPPSSSYPTSQARYGPPTYGAPQPTHPSYGQQQPPPYNSSYTDGYSQSPAYPSDVGSPSASASLGASFVVALDTSRSGGGVGWLFRSDMDDIKANFVQRFYQMIEQ